VIVLAPENTGKLCNRWQGPGTVVKVKSPHSYLVDLGGGNIRHLHANKMRQFVARIQGCGVIAECDFDFGRIVVPDFNNTVFDESKLPSRQQEAATINISRHSRDRNCYRSSTSSATVSLIQQDDATS